ncbi:MAG: tetratricopeptide repeat protein [Chloroflexota bacterium]
MPAPHKLSELVKLREKAALTQSDAAIFFGLSKRNGRKTIIDWESGKYNPPESKRREQFIIYLLDKLLLRRELEHFEQIWNTIAVEQWAWYPLSELEWQKISYVFRGSQYDEYTEPGYSSRQTSDSITHDKVTPLHNLPANLTTFIGHERDINEIKGKLCNGHRLITLYGPGGVGKTRLAIEIARKCIDTDNFTDGIFSISLASVNNAVGMVNQIAQTLNLELTSEIELFESLIKLLVNKAILLILDNFEQLVPEAPKLNDLLSRCPMLKLLVTSREILNIRPELSCPVLPLQLPEKATTPSSIQDFLQVESIALFVERAQSTIPQFELTQETANTVVDLCIRLDGLPLAIELAAAQTSSFTPAEMLEHLNSYSSLELLTDGPRDLPERQQTILSTIEWSYNHLSVAEKITFRRLSVFVSGFTLEMAQRVLAVDKVSLLQVANRIESLRRKSLILWSMHDDKGIRFTMLEIIREYGVKQLCEHNEIEAAQLNHATLCLELAEEVESDLSSSQYNQWLSRLRAEHDNLRTALQWAIETNHQRGATSLRLAGALCDYWTARAWELSDIEFGGYITEGRQWLSQALCRADLGVDPAIHAKALHASGSLAEKQSDFAFAQTCYEDSLSIRQKQNDASGVAESLNSLGKIAGFEGNYERAGNCLEESIRLYRQIGDDSGLASALNNLGVTQEEQGYYDQALSTYEDSLVIFQKMNRPWAVSVLLNNIGQIHFWQDDLDNALIYYEDSRKIAEKVNDRSGIAFSLHNQAEVYVHRQMVNQAIPLQRKSLEIWHDLHDLQNIALSLELGADIFCLQGNQVSAIQIFSAANMLRKSIGSPIPIHEHIKHEEKLTSLLNIVGDISYNANWQVGQKLDWKEAINYFLEQSLKLSAR